MNRYGINNRGQLFPKANGEVVFFEDAQAAIDAARAEAKAQPVTLLMAEDEE